MSDQISKESNSTVLGLFVSAVGRDYKKDYSPHIHPEFSEDTKEYWGEIESRMKEPTCLNFDRDGCLQTLRKEVNTQSGSLKNGPDYDTSYHYGIRSGLWLAMNIIESHVK